MANLTTLARPYANAIFALAKENANIQTWCSVLKNIQEIVVLQKVQDMLANPNVSEQDFVNELVYGLSIKDTEIVKFLNLIALNNRVLALPAIYELYVELMKKEQNEADAIIQSACQLEDSYIKEIEAILSKKFNVRVNAKVEIKKELIGGIKVLLNDTVIDASIKSSLEKLAIQLTQ